LNLIEKKAEKSIIEEMLNSTKSEFLAIYVRRRIKTHIFQCAEIKVPENWFKAFDMLTDALDKNPSQYNKIILFFNEFPWMAMFQI